MKRKALSIILGAAMTATMLAGCGGGNSAAPTEASSAATEASSAATEASSAATEASSAATEASSVEEAPAAETASLPTDYKYYFSMDQADPAVHAAIQDKTATPIVQIDDSQEISYIPGVKGQAAYTNGTYGFKLDVEGVGDTYSVSYWMYASRSAQYMPTLQFGPDMHGDATGGQHYTNFTWASWNPTSDDLSFPSVWSYDQNADGSPWPNWYSDEVNDMTRKWVNVTMTVDPADLDAGTGLIPSHLYINGEELTGKDGNGNIRPINVVTNVMAPSDNFDFLLGVNYWDAIFKGAFDEVYVFDRVLTAGEAKALYEAGDATVAFEEPERVIEVVASDAAIDHVGTTDLSLGFWTDWSKSTEIKDGETKEIVLRNFSDGAANWDNYLLLFTNEETPAHEDPNTSGSADHKEYGVIRADAYGWSGDQNSENNTEMFQHEWTWGNWGTWLQQCMMDTTATITIGREGDTITIVASNKDLNGTDNVCTTRFKPGITADDPCFFQVAGEKCYIDIFKIGDAIVIKPTDGAVDAIGNTNLDNAFWSDWTESYELADGATKKVKLKNYSAATNNWENFVIALTNTKSEAHKAPADQSADYMEYAVLRADAWGWGAPEGDAAAAADCYNFTTSWGDDWAGWLDMMKAADVDLTFSRKGAEITVDFVFTGRDGSNWTEQAVVKNSALAADSPVYFFFTNEKSFVEILSVE